MSSKDKKGAPPRSGSDWDFEEEPSETGTPEAGAGAEETEQGEPAKPWHQDADRLKGWEKWIWGAVVLLLLAIFTPVGWFIAILLLFLVCVALVALLLGGGAVKHAAGGEHGDKAHGGDSHGDKAHGPKDGADLVIKEADDLGIVNPPPETRTKLGAFGLYTIRDDSSLVFYDSWFQRFYPNGDGARERLPDAIRAHVPPGRWVGVPIVCVLRGRIDLSTRLVPFDQTVKIKGGRTVTVEGTAYVRAKQSSGGTISASDMRKLIASFDGSKSKLVVTALQGALDKAAIKFAITNIDGQLQAAAHAIEAKVNEELAKYGLELENLHFDTVQDPAEQEAGQVERLRESGAFEPMAIVHGFMQAAQTFAGNFGKGGGGQSDGNNSGGQGGKKGGGNQGGGKGKGGKP